MNKKIKELSSLAYKKAVERSKTEPNMCKVGSDYFLEMEKEILAQLVIEECVRVAIKADNEDREYAWFAIEKHFK